MTTQSTLGASAYDDALLVRCPKAFSDTVRHAAKSQLMGVSAYIRQATLRQLKIDGCDSKSEET